MDAVNQQIQARQLPVKPGRYVNANITLRQCQPKTRPINEVVQDREASDAEVEAPANMQLLEVSQLAVNDEVRWVKSGSKAVLCNRQCSLADEQGMVNAVSSIPANCHDSWLLVDFCTKLSFPKAPGCMPKKRIIRDKIMRLSRHKGLNTTYRTRLSKTNRSVHVKSNATAPSVVSNMSLTEPAVNSAALAPKFRCCGETKPHA